MCQDVARSEFDTSHHDEVESEATHPYPEGVFCVCPWMTLIIDSWGNLYPCSHRMDVAMGNILHQPLEQAMNTIGRLKLRHGMMKGKHNEVCPSCISKTPASDPMRRKLTRRIPAKATVHHEPAGAVAIAAGNTTSEHTTSCATARVP